MSTLHPQFAEVVGKVEELLNSPRLFVFGRIDAWLKAGADPELDIYPVLKRIAANGRWSGSNLSYFDRAVMQSHADRTMPAPIMTPTPKRVTGAYVAPPSDPISADTIDRSRAELMMKGIRVPAVTDRDAHRMVARGYLSAERAREFGFDVPEMQKAGSVEADPRPMLETQR